MVIECVGVEGTHGGCLADTWTYKTLLRKCGIDHHQSALYKSTLSLIYIHLCIFIYLDIEVPYCGIDIIITKVCHDAV